jgi:hypothetical protein
MSICVADLRLTFRLDEFAAEAARQSEYPRISKRRRESLAEQIALLDNVPIEEAHRQIHEQLRVW